MKHKRGCFIISVAPIADVDAYAVSVTDVDHPKSFLYGNTLKGKNKKQNRKDIEQAIGSMVMELIKEKK